MPNFTIIGLMSGTSLDGLDIAACSFFQDSVSEAWNYHVLQAETIKYHQQLIHELDSISDSSASKLVETDHALGRCYGREVRAFIQKYQIKADFIASHGHTVFHRPDLGYTCQIGHGAQISAISGLPVVCDFRSTDVAYGGQGAPLVPIGDRLLFGLYSHCLNLGGIANISFEENGQRKAYDICPLNMVFNFLARKIGLEYDRNGEIAASGNIIPELLNTLEYLDFYQKIPPKSLGKEWVWEHFIPYLQNTHAPIPDLIATCTLHSAQKIVSEILKTIPGTGGKAGLLCTGGGAFNGHLIQLITNLLDKKCTVVVPDKMTIEFKEAIVFAFLGLLRWNGKANCLASVTGANQDVCGGTIYLPSAQS